VPAGLQQRVSFPIYYPDPKKLPAGYTLIPSSFHLEGSNSEAVLYTVSYSGNKKLVFTIQQKPSSHELANFVKLYIPVHRIVATVAGIATVGSINQQTVVSLPTDTKAWILVTGPSDLYGTDQLSQVLKAIRR
jgi:hypothetical protein